MEHIYYISSKNPEGVRGWSVVNESGHFVATVSGGGGLMVCQAAVEALNGNKFDKRDITNHKRLTEINYDDMLIRNTPNVRTIIKIIGRDTLTLSEILKRQLLLTPDNIYSVLALLIKEGWVYSGDDDTLIHDVEPGKYQVSLMGRFKSLIEE